MSTLTSKSIAILGAGVSGLSAAYYLKKNGFEVKVFEREEYYGGLARSFIWHGFTCDFAAHRFFTNDEDVLHSVFQLNPMLRHIRRSKLYLKRSWVNDPVNPIELLPLLSNSEKLSLIKELSRPIGSTDGINNFEDFILARYGKTMHNNFFQPSTEKLFRIPASEISVLWAKRKARLVNPFKKMDGKSRKYFSYFYYPLEGGYGSICDAYFGGVNEDVIMSAEVTSIICKDEQVTAIQYQQNGQTKTYNCDAVISTLPLTITASMLGIDVPLSFQKVDAVYLLLNKPEAGPYHWVYFIDSDMSINRMVEFKHMSRYNTPPNTTVLCAEVTSEEENLTAKVIFDLVRSGYLKEKDVLDSLVIREEYAYPVYKVGYETIVAETLSQIQKNKGVYILGRSAEFIHREVDDIIDASKKLVKRLLLEERGSNLEMVTEDTVPDTIAIVVLSYNNVFDTLECIASLEKIEGGPYHIYLVDNGSSDDTLGQVRKQYPLVEILALNSNFGVPIGFNKGIIKALKDGYNYVLILNNDTVSDPAMIGELLKVAKRDDDCGIVMPKVCYYPPKNVPLSRDDVWADGGYFRRFPPTILLKDKRKNVNFDNPRKIEYAPTCGLLIHRRAFENVGLFDEGFFFFYEDWDYSERLRSAGLNIWVAPDALLWHKVSRTTRKDMSNYWRQMGESTGRFMKRHFLHSERLFQQSYLIIRDFFLKPYNIKYLKKYLQGLKAGSRKTLDTYPDLSVLLYGNPNDND